MSVREATIDDLVALMLIERRAHEHPWAESIMLRYLNKSQTVWVLEFDNSVRAYAVVTVIAGEAELLMIAVDPDYQGNGHGRALMEFLITHIKTRAAERFFLEVRESNMPAIALYESLEFCQSGCRNNYYPTATGREDALMYCLELID